MKLIDSDFWARNDMQVNVNNRPVEVTSLKLSNPEEPVTFEVPHIFLRKAGTSIWAHIVRVNLKKCIDHALLLHLERPPEQSDYEHLELIQVDNALYLTPKRYIKYNGQVIGEIEYDEIDKPGNITFIPNSNNA